MTISEEEITKIAFSVFGPIPTDFSNCNSPEEARNIRGEHLVKIETWKAGYRAAISNQAAVSISNEEIEASAISMYGNPFEGNHWFQKKEAYIHGAKWMRDRLSGKNGL